MKDSTREGNKPQILHKVMLESSYQLTHTPIFCLWWISESIYDNFCLTLAVASQVAWMVKNLPANSGATGDSCSIKIPWRNKWQSTPVFLARKSQGQMSLEDYSPYDLNESNMTGHACIHPLNLVAVKHFCQECSIIWTIWQFLIKLSINWAYNPATLLLAIYPRKYHNTCAYKDL